ncbi:MAG: ABC transporter substrate-binding protein [Oscillospiraceae bacterium]
MKNVKSRLLAAVLALGMLMTACSKSEPAPAKEQETTGTKTVVDMTGREVEIPADVKSVHATSPVGQNIMYSINPDKMAGWCTEMCAAESHFIAEKYCKLPVLGGNFGKNNKLNPEVVVKANPDIILNIGTINDTTADEADKLQEQLGIPVIVAESTAKNIDKCYDFLGDVLNEKETCQKLSTYCKNVIDTVTENSAKIADEDKVSVYYAEGSKGLETDPSGSPHAIVLDMVGCVNVADVETASGYGRAEVSPEQLLVWNPDMVIICPDTNGAIFDGDVDSLYKQLKSENKGIWSELSAIQNGNFYEVPVGPFNWFDRPPSVNQILGLQWCGNLVYPEVYDYDMKKVSKEFFDMFYHYDLTDEEYDLLLSHSTKN